MWRRWRSAAPKSLKVRGVDVDAAEQGCSGPRGVADVGGMWHRVIHKLSRVGGGVTCSGAWLMWRRRNSTAHKSKVRGVQGAQGRD